MLNVCLWSSLNKFCFVTDLWCFFYRINIDKPRLKSRIPALLEHPEAQNKYFINKKDRFYENNIIYFEINRNKYNLCHINAVVFAHSMMCFKSSRREHLLFFRAQSVWLDSSWNKHVAVNFKDRNMGAIKCKSKVIGKAEYVLMFQLPCCTDASVWRVTNDCVPVYLGTSQPPKRSTPVRIKVQSAELLWRSHTIDHMHGNIPGTWLFLMLDQEPFGAADLLAAEKLRTSVYCQTNTLCTTYFPLTFLDIFVASSMIILSSWVLFGWGGGLEAASMMKSTVPISARLWTMKVFMALRRLWQVVSRFSRLLERAASNIASFLLGWQDFILHTSEEERHQIRTVSIWRIITCSIRCRILVIK